MNTFHQANESILIVPVPIATLEYYQSLSFNIKHLGRSFIYLLCVRAVILKICKFADTMEKTIKDTSNCLEKVMKISHLNQTNSALYLYYDRTLLLFSRPMRVKDTSALREMIQHY